MSENQGKMPAYSEVAIGGGAVSSPAERPANPTERVITAYTIAARGGAKLGESAFDIAVSVYLNEFPEMDRAAAARIVADIVTHRL
jgi:hypothetical protein